MPPGTQPLHQLTAEQGWHQLGRTLAAKVPTRLFHAGRSRKGLRHLMQLKRH